MAIFASIAASLDGFIRTESGDMAWLNDAMRRDEDYGMTRTMQRVGAYVVGATTYRESVAMFGGGMSTMPQIYVLTHAFPEEAPSGVTFTSEDIRDGRDDRPVHDRQGREHLRGRRRARLEVPLLAMSSTARRSP